jgi:hypothetical protein
MSTDEPMFYIGMVSNSDTMHWITSENKCTQDLLDAALFTESGVRVYLFNNEGSFTSHLKTQVDAVSKVTVSKILLGVKHD